MINGVVAGFAGKSSLMKVDSLQALTYIIKQGGLEPAFLEELLDVTLLLFKEKNREVYKGLVKFLKAYLKMQILELSEKKLSVILTTLLTIDDQSRGS